MLPVDGIIKYQLTLDESPITPPSQFSLLNGWRRLLRKLDMIGQRPDRYNGSGFGNLSMRIPDRSESFLITGSQTGHISQLGPEHYAEVYAVDLDENSVWARGLSQPSSESMTHALLYKLYPEISCVIHVHAPAIWQAAKALELPSVPGNIAYGTPDIARSIAKIQQQYARLPGLMTMDGHEDGLICYGRTIEDAGQLLVKMLAQAWAVASS